ncbi:MAG: zinc ribbon domain-containing protein [Clostridia bacterium]|nr:zinc ribbon domain-containing protein [Clostridia bacterium]
MANCPKCGKKLKKTDWRQHCPECGANIVVYDLQERLMKDADIAEVQYYHFQKKVDRLKASFIGTKLAVARIITSLLPAAPLFLPLVKASFSPPVDFPDGNVNLMTVVNHFGAINPETLKALPGGEARADSLLLIAGTLLFALSVVLTLVHFILLTLACSPKGRVRNIVQDVLILLTCTASAVCIAAMGSAGAVKATLAVGTYLYILLQVVNVAVDIAVLIQGIPITHRQCYVGGIPIEEYFELEKTLTPEELRAEQYRRLSEIQKEKEEKIAEDEAKKHHGHIPGQNEEKGADADG